MANKQHLRRPKFVGAKRRGWDVRRVFARPQGAGSMGSELCEAGQSLQSRLCYRKSVVETEFTTWTESLKSNALGVQRCRACITILFSGIWTQCGRVVPPAEPACSINSGQANARNRAARANSGDASRGVHNDRDGISECPGRAKMTD